MGRRKEMKRERMKARKKERVTKVRGERSKEEKK